MNHPTPYDKGPNHYDYSYQCLFDTECHRSLSMTLEDNVNPINEYYDPFKLYLKLILGGMNDF